MRMWMTNPKMLCRKHLIGEHGEIHKFRPSFIKKHNMENRVRYGQIDHTRMKQRHDELVNEMLCRGYKHKSPYEQPDVSYIQSKPCVSIKWNVQDLKLRCEACKKRLEKTNVKNN